MKYFGVNRKIPVESKHWDGPKERLKQNEIVTHLIEIDLIKLGYVPKNFKFVHEQYRNKFKVETFTFFDKVKIYLTGKRKELQEEFGRVNEVQV